MKKIVLVFSAALMLCGFSAKANNNVLEGQLVRQTLLSKDVKALMVTDEDGKSLPLRIVYQKDLTNTFEVYDPTQENLVIVKDVDVELVDGALTATVMLNVNGKSKVSKVYTKDGIKAPWYPSVN
jgi:aspartokinase-like uncharacterized kinase